jgi:hypothetical protein
VGIYGGAAGLSSTGEEGDKTDGRGQWVKERREEVPRMEGLTQRGKHILERTPMARGPDGLAEQSDGLQGRLGHHGQTWAGP